MTPEERARQQIDLLLQQSGWIVQDRSQINLAAGPGVAIREAVLKTGEADYLLFADGKAIATVEAKPEGYTLDEVAGLDLRRTTPPITDILGFIRTTCPSHRVLLATQVYEKLNPTSLRDVQALLDWSELRVYDLNDAGKNHGILLGTSGWKP